MNWRKVLSWNLDNKSDLESLNGMLDDVFHLDYGVNFKIAYEKMLITDIVEYAKDILENEEEWYSDEEDNDDEETQSYLNSLKNLYNQRDYKGVVREYVKMNSDHGEIAGSFVRYLIDNQLYIEAYAILDLLINEDVGFSL